MSQKELCKRGAAGMAMATQRSHETRVIPNKKTKYDRRREHDQIARDHGLTPVRGAVSGRRYYE